MRFTFTKKKAKQLLTQQKLRRIKMEMIELRGGKKGLELTKENLLKTPRMELSMDSRIMQSLLKRNKDMTLKVAIGLLEEMP